MPDRHPATTALLRYFEYGHLPERLQPVSKPCGDLARQMVDLLGDGPELTVGLRKLLEAKDCLVRAAIDAPLYDDGGILRPGITVAENRTGADERVEFNN